MTADDMLDQDHWHAGVDVAHLLVEHGAAVAELRARRLTADQQIRAAALHAAVLRHRDVASWEPDGTDVMLRTAERFETWIRDEGESHGRSSPGSGPAGPNTASNPAGRYQTTGETAQGHTAPRSEDGR